MFIGEPSMFDKEGKCYLRNASDWKAKTKYIDEVATNFTNIKKAGRSPLVVIFKNSYGDTFKFDLEETNETIDEQLTNFVEWAK